MVFRLGNIPWNKGKRGHDYLKHYKNCIHPNKGRHMWKDKPHPRGMLGKPNYSVRERNKDPVYKKMYIDALNRINASKVLRKKNFLSRHIRPNKPEKYVQKLLDVHFFKQYKYVGDGKLIIGGLCPDFIWKNKKLIIEVFGDYWHKTRADSITDTEEGRKERFKECGYDCLIIWESQLNKLPENEIIQKIKEFTDQRK